MSRLLINENPLQVLPTLACAIGLNEAIVLQQIHYWMGRCDNQRDGRRWVYNSVSKWSEQFPFWSESTVKRTLQSLEDAGLILSANYNEDKRDRTKWYSINQEALTSIEKKLLTPDGFSENALGQFEDNAIGQNDPNTQGQIDPLRDIRMTQPLPEITTETTQEITTENKTTGAQANTCTPTAEKKSPSKKKQFNPVTAKPENVSAEIWQDWIKHRKEIGHRLTETTCRHQAKQLAGHQNPDEVIRRSIAGGWQGLFPEKVPSVAPNAAQPVGAKPFVYNDPDSSEVFIDYDAMRSAMSGSVR